AANDYMALGAVSALRSVGMRVPRDAIIAGFDDSPSSRLASPSLSTVRQPWRRLAHAAVGALARFFMRAPVQEETELDVDVVLRQSCGCGYRVRQNRGSLVPPGLPRDLLSEIEERRPLLLQVMESMVGFSRDLSPGWPERLLGALSAEVAG